MAILVVNHFNMERNSNDTWLPPWTRLEHEARYDFAALFVHGMRVVDCACGSGIGSMRFAAKGALVVQAIDSSLEAVRQAAAANTLSNLQVSQGDATKIELADNSADVFISLETIEHLEADAELIEEAYRILRPGGVFICSTPNREMTNPGTSILDKPWNPFHVREYSLEEFRACLERRFVVEGVYGQNPASKSRTALGKWLASTLGPGLAIKINKALKCRWFILPRPRHHAVRRAAENHDYEFYILVGKVPEPKP